MLNVFRKLLQKDLGRGKYEEYCCYYEAYRQSKSNKQREEGNKLVYKAIYDSLKNAQEVDLEKRMNRVIDSMCDAVAISKRYIITFLVYLGSSLFLIAKNLQPGVTLPALFLLSALFLYETCVYVANRYCYIDANIILVYKMVLDHLMRRKEVR